MQPAFALTVLVAVAVQPAATALTVGVIGGGVAGLSCARRLQELGLDPVVYDTGKHAPGGRCSSRLWRGRPADHAAQFAAATTPEFEAVMEELVRDDAAYRLASEHIKHLRSCGAPPEPAPADGGATYYVGVGGMGSLPKAFASGLDVRQDVWISPSNGIRYESGGGWLVRESKSVERRFDALVIAHNGKCAERLTSKQPARDIHALLRARFKASLGKGGGGGGGCMTLNSIYSLLVELPAGALPPSLGQCMTFVHCEPALRFLGNNEAKHPSPVGGGAPATEVWTVLSSAAFGAKHKAPQEFLEGTEVEAEVTKLLLEAVARAAGLPDDALAAKAVATKLQLWGAAVPINAWEGADAAEFAYNSKFRIGIAGDWLRAGSVGGGSSPSAASTIEGAWLSGRRLASHVHAAAQQATAGAGAAAEGVAALGDVGLSLGPSGGAFVPVGAGGFADDGEPAGGEGRRWVAAPDADGPRAKPPRKRSGGGGGGSGGGGAAAAASGRLFIRNLPYQASEEELASHLGARCDGLVVSSVTLLRSPEGQSRGMAKVDVSTADAAARVIAALDGAKLGGRPLRIAHDVEPPRRRRR